MHVNSPLGTKVSVEHICRGCELEISRILLIVDLRVMDMSKFDVILGMDWSTTHRVVMIVIVGGLLPTHRTMFVLCFRWISTTLYPEVCRILYGTKGWLASLTLDDKVRQDLGQPWVVCEYEDVFPNELPGLPPHGDVDFTIELHPSTSPISMTLRRMVPTELQELKV